MVSRREFLAAVVGGSVALGCASVPVPTTARHARAQELLHAEMDFVNPKQVVGAVVSSHGQLRYLICNRTFIHYDHLPLRHRNPIESIVTNHNRRRDYMWMLSKPKLIALHCQNDSMYWPSRPLVGHGHEMVYSGTLYAKVIMTWR